MANHNYKKELYEYRAKNTLVSIYPNEFYSLAKGEKPDWQDLQNSIGVEVVQATNPATRAGKHRASKVSGKSIDSLSQKELSFLGKYGGTIYTERDLGISKAGIITSYITTTNEVDKMIVDAFSKKISLINTTQEKYLNLDSLFLYIISDASVGWVDVNKLFMLLKATQKTYNHQFDGVFLDDGYFLYRYSFSDGRLAKTELNDFAKDIFTITIQEVKK